MPITDSTIEVIKPSGSVEEDTARLTELAQRARQIFFDPGSGQPLRLNRTIRFGLAGQRFWGSAPWASTVEWHGDPDKATVFALRGNQYMSISNMMIRPGHWGTPQEIRMRAGAAITIEDENGTSAAFCELDNIFIHAMADGVLVGGGAEHRIRRLQLRKLRGRKGLRFFAPSKARALYRCIVDDMVSAEAESPEYDAIDHNSYSYSVEVDKAALLNGGRGYTMADDVADGASYPMWAFAQDLETDHTAQGGVELWAGEGFEAVTSWFGSSLGGAGLLAGGAWRGDLALSACRIYGNAREGMSITAGKGAALSGLLVGDNGVMRPGSMAGILIGGQAENISIAASCSGDMVGVRGNAQGWGVILHDKPRRVNLSSFGTLEGNQRGKILNETRTVQHEELIGAHLSEESIREGRRSGAYL
ncbi:hypothetical protein J8J14_17395 [Roseomonas sp. SSH11]|uniref:Uncharacterized protein n=1 Tax=Pararoseomonas baculiformis TaxID=2820812 RepID=A0ABS4AHN8_9PROT|nr:hypothetical protein [Pararoseomonas baculiformis]MBP0446552.1 hypothetical protein [Pararoseomonas baculiformis]